MSEHEPIDAESFKILSARSRRLTLDEEEGVANHLMFRNGHEDDGYEVLYGSEGTPELEAKYADNTRAHLAAVLRGEVSIEDLCGELYE